MFSSCLSSSFPAIVVLIVTGTCVVGEDHDEYDGLFPGISNIAVRLQRDTYVKHVRQNAFYGCASVSGSIAPCTCHESRATFTISCGYGLTLANVQRALNRKFSDAVIPKLNLTGCYILQLPTNAFQSAAIFPKRLYIQRSNLRYIAKDAFAGLEQTTALLELGDNKLFTVPTEALRALPKLSTLSLAHNFIMAIESSSFQGLRLRVLILSGNRISTIENGAFNRELRQLSLAHNHIYSLNDTLRGLKKLQWLFLDNNRITSLKGELTGLVSLKWLSITNNLIEHIGDAFHDLHNLEHLKISSNNIHRLGGSLHPLTSLITLNLSRNHMTEISEDDLLGLTHVKTLDLSGNHLSHLGASALRDLRLSTLNLSDNVLVEVDLSVLRDLTLLDLSHNKMTTLEGVFQGSETSPWLTSLRASDNNIGSLQKSLRLLKHLQHLDISNNRVTSLDKQNFSRNNKLKNLKLEGNPLKCDYQLIKVLDDLQTRHVQIGGQPTCTLRDINKV